MSDASQTTAPTRLQRQVLAVAIVASFMAILDSFVVSLALPAIGRELGGGLRIQQWVVDAYLLTLGALILAAGSLSDHFGRVRVLQWGLGGFALTSVLCGAAWTGEILVVSRGLQGVAGALLVPSSLALIVSHFDSAAQGSAIGKWSAWTSAAAIVAPLIGGVSVDLLSWRVIFFVNVLPAAAIWPVLARLRKADDATSPAGIDIAGALLAVVALGGPVYGLIEQGSAGWGSPQVWLPLAAGLVATVLFLIHESRTAAPLLPLRMFTVRNFGWGNIATAAIYGGFSLGFFALGIYIQQVGGMKATTAGLALLPSTVILTLLASFFGGLAGKYGPRWFMTAGPVLCAAGFLLTLSVGGSLNYWTQILPGQVVFGLGLSMTVAPLTAAILGSVPEKQAGVGSAVNNAVSRIAGLVCIAFAGFIVGPELTTAGLHRALLATAALLLLGGVCSAVGIRNPVPASPASPASPR
jgi:EmrB/QacA subfamily drug resistance transporter